DTTIMASAGAHCDHVNHVSTQLPYALTAAAVSFAGYILAGVLGYTLGTGIAMIATPVSIAILIVTLVVIKKQTANK
ncbi:MAG: Na+/H+ antiporter NhaC family protein, partial [Clostridia bacterium]|nr:Na+/H+ antiporter NhaC family protein [Clostridia bacterium]